MNLVPLRKELSNLLFQLNALSPSEKQFLLTFLTCSVPLPGDTSSLHAPANPSGADSVSAAPSETVGDSVAVINLTFPEHDWNTAFLQGETFTLGFFDGSQENSTQLENSDESTHFSAPISSPVLARDPPIESDPSIIINGEVSPLETDTNPPTSNGMTCKHTSSNTLHCPLCRLEFVTWIELEKHLYAAHTSSIAPVCWRCQGLFDNHAVLLAHECFDWGRLNLPCQALLKNSSSAYATRQKTLLRLRSSDLGYPVDGVYLRRRCGLCYKSSAMFTSHEEFQNHKTSAHSVDEVVPLSPDFRRTVRPVPGTEPVTMNSPSNRFSHPQSESSLRSMIRHLLHHFWRLQSRGPKPSADSNGSHCNAGTQPSDCESENPSADRLLGDGCTETDEGSLHINAHYPSGLQPLRRSSRYRPTFRCAQYTRTMPTKRLRKPPDNWPVNPYHKHYMAKIGSFTCHCCSAVFRLASRLRAHYLFKHGHIPESLGGLTQTGNEASISRKRLLNDSTEYSSNASDSSETTLESNYVNKRRTSHRTIRCTRKLGPAVRFSQPLVSENYVDPVPSSQPDNTSSRRRSTLHHDVTSLTSKAHKRKRITRITRTSITSTEPLDPNSNVSSSSQAEAEYPSDNEELYVLRLSENAQSSTPTYQCTLCQRVYSRVCNLQRHYKQVHKGVYRFFCGYCDFRTNDRSGLDEHLARHFRLKQFACGFCSARFIVQRELSDHLAFKHNSERRHQCPICSQTFKTAGTLSRHKKVHNGHRRIACNLCSLTFTRPSNLKRHMNRRHRTTRGNCPINSEGTTTEKRSRTQRRSTRARRVTPAILPGSQDTTSGAPAKTAPHTQRDNSTPDTSISLTASNTVSSDPLSASVELQATTENQIVTTTTLVTTEPSVFPINTVFVPYITANIEPSVTTSLTISDEVSITVGTSNQLETSALSRDYKSTYSTEKLGDHPAEPVSVAQNTVLPSITFASLFPIHITHQFPPTESSMPQGDWPSPSEDSFETHSNAPTDASLPFNCYTTSDNVTRILPSSVAINQADSSDESNLSNIWRPVECDVRSIPPSVETIPLHIINPFHDESGAHHASCLLPGKHANDGNADVAHLVPKSDAPERTQVHDFPRFPSPLPESFSPSPRHRHPTSSSATPPLPPTSELTADLVSFCTESVIEQTNSFVPPEGNASSPDPLQSSASESTYSEPIIFHPLPYSNSNCPIPVQLLVCDSHSGCPQFIPSMWNCQTPLESVPPYPTSMCLAPSVSSHQPVTYSCPNFSVGYLIGQPSSCGPIRSEDHVPSSIMCSTSSPDLNTVYFGFDSTSASET